MITLTIGLENLRPATIVALIQDMREAGYRVSDYKDLWRQLVALVGTEDAQKMLAEAEVR